MKNISSILIAMSMFLSSAAIAQSDGMKNQNTYSNPDSMNRMDRTIRQEDSMRTKKSNPQYDRKTETSPQKNQDTIRSDDDNRKTRRQRPDSARMRKDTIN